MSEWTTQRLEEIIQVNPTVKLTKGEVYPFIDIDKVSPTLRSVTNEEEKVYDGQSCSKFCNGDTVFSRITPCLENRKIAKVSIDGQAAFGSTEFYIFRAKEGKSDENFVYYLTSSDAVVLPAINSMTGASGRQRADKRFIERTKLNVPDLPTQKRIAEILSAYDDLIENNNRRIALLEKAAQELYKEWFVRFRFPGHETTKFENGLPEEWKVLTVNNTFEIYDSKRIPISSMERDKMKKIYPYYGAAELMDYVDDYIFDGIYLLLGEDGSVIRPNGKPILQYVWGKIWVNNHAHVLQGKNPYSTEFLHLMFNQMDITGIVTGSAQPKISQGRLFKKKTILPPDDILARFDLVIQPIYQKIRQLTEANQNLEKQRDLLLPRLMSGELEV